MNRYRNSGRSRFHRAVNLDGLEKNFIGMTAEAELALEAAESGAGILKEARMEGDTVPGYEFEIILEHAEEGAKGVLEFVKMARKNAGLGRR